MATKHTMNKQTLSSTSSLQTSDSKKIWHGPIANDHQS